jgi:Protein of unknown function (DUF5132)
MAIFDDDKRGYIIGAAAAFAAATIFREFRTEFRDLGRPLAKAAIKSGLALMDKTREVMAHVGEVVEDLTVEARYELDAERSSSSEPAQEPSTPENSGSREVH